MKKPTLQEFEKVLQATGGNLTNAAKALNCGRTAIWQWAKTDEGFANAIDESRMKLFDRCLSTAQILALGIPQKDAQGNVIGWLERPDSGMLRYFMSTLGRREGFSESLDITTNGESVKFPVISEKDVDDFLREQRESL